MRRSKRYLSGIIAVLMCISVAGCTEGDSSDDFSPDSSDVSSSVNDSSDKSSRDDSKKPTSSAKDSIDDSSSDESLDGSSSQADNSSSPDISGDYGYEISDIPAGEENVLNWLSYFDLNPGVRDKYPSVELSLFQAKGGYINYEFAPSGQEYTKLAALMLVDNPPDMFWYDQGMAFPYGCVRNMFQPIDPIVDFDDSLWSDVRDIAQIFTIGESHYVAPVAFTMSSLLTYDLENIYDMGFDDPYELYLSGEWSWDILDEIMREWVSSGRNRKGLNGWFNCHIFASTGETIIQRNEQTGLYVNNLYSKNLERAADWLYDLTKDGIIDNIWYDNAGSAFKDGYLFFAMGPWASSDAYTPKENQNWASVPMPYDPYSGSHYVRLDTEAYMWVNGSTKDAAMKCWLECVKLANTDAALMEVTKQRFFEENPYWTDEMYDLAYTPLEWDPDFSVIFDPGYGLTVPLSDNYAASNDVMEAMIPYIYSSVSRLDDKGKQYTWDSLLKKYNKDIDTELDSINKSIAALQ